jgi:hypothetical protein
MWIEILKMVISNYQEQIYDGKIQDFEQNV